MKYFQSLIERAVKQALLAYHPKLAVLIWHVISTFSQNQPNTTQNNRNCKRSIKLTKGSIDDNDNISNTFSYDRHVKHLLRGDKSYKNPSFLTKKGSETRWKWKYDLALTSMILKMFIRAPKNSTTKFRFISWSPLSSILPPSKSKLRQ